MVDAFLLRALAAGAGVAVMSGPLGCFIAWQRLAYFGDTIAHAALLGVVLALLTHAPLAPGIMLVAVLVACGVWKLGKSGTHAFDTLLGLFAHGALALALVLLSLSRGIAFDVNALLFGDILAVSDADIGLIYAIAVMVLLFIMLCWRPLMAVTLHGDIARVEGVPAERLRLVLMLMIALAVAVSVKIIGVLLMSSMLIIPAAAARYFSRNPSQMIVLAVLAGLFSVCGGLSASLIFDTPSGPSIILAALTLFAVSAVFRRR